MIAEREVQVTCGALQLKVVNIQEIQWYPTIREALMARPKQRVDWKQLQEVLYQTRFRLMQGHCRISWAKTWWGRGVPARHPKAVRFCAIGAFHRACLDLSVHEPYARECLSDLFDRYHYTIQANDGERASRDELLRRLDLVIAEVGKRIGKGA